MAHPDLDRLLDFSLRFAQSMLEKRGAFLPFAAIVDASNEVKPLAIHTDDDSPSPQALLEQYAALIKDLASRAEAIATAVGYDGRVSATGEPNNKKDAITVALEHSNGEAVVIFLPYKKKLFGGYRYDPLIAVAGERKYFL